MRNQTRNPNCEGSRISLNVNEGALYFCGFTVFSINTYVLVRSFRIRSV